MAHSQSAAQSKTGAYLAADSRADHGTRWVTVTKDVVQIDRFLSGMKMRIHVPTDAYLGISLHLREIEETVVCEIRLAHRDSDLSVTLESTDDRSVAMGLCHQWSEHLGQPVLGERKLSLAGERPQEASKARRRCWTQIANRRPRRLARRKNVNLTNLGTVRHGEREIICYE